MSSYELKPAVKDKFEPIVLDFIDKAEIQDRATCALAISSIHDENGTTDFVEQEFSAFRSDMLELDLSGTSLSPYALWKLLEGLGYSKSSFDQNGWQFDFWITFEKAGYKTLLVSGTGITFNLRLSVKID